jgi:hypothetical protein
MMLRNKTNDFLLAGITTEDSGTTLSLDSGAKLPFQPIC